VKGVLGEKRHTAGISACAWIMRKREIRIVSYLFIFCINLGCLDLSSASQSLSPSALAKLFTSCFGGAVGSRRTEEPICLIPEQKSEAVPDVKLMHNEKGLDHEIVNQVPEKQGQSEEKVREQSCEPAPQPNAPSLEAEAPPLRKDSETKPESFNVQHVNNYEGSREKDVVEPPCKVKEASVENKKDSMSKEPARSAHASQAAPPEKIISKRTISPTPTEKKPAKAKAEDSKSKGGKGVERDNSSDWDPQVITIPCKDPLVDWRESSKCISGNCLTRLSSSCICPKAYIHAKTGYVVYVVMLIFMPMC
jgi:hypothetical protein